MRSSHTVAGQLVGASVQGERFALCLALYKRTVVVLNEFP
jgi:hypothetical protein